MKKIYLLLFILFLTTSTKAQSYNQLLVTNPHGWESALGSIDEAELSISPKGAYLEYGLYLTFSARNTYLENYTENFEIIYDFTLPKGAIITDSWLWVEDSIVHADILERNRAGGIYEGIVNRRKDPSILFKNSMTDYQLRVYPIPGNRSRKVKITFLLPVKFTAGKATAILPVKFLTAAANLPDYLKVTAYTDTNFTSPSIEKLPNLVFNITDTLNKIYSTQLPSSSLTGDYELSYNTKNNDTIHLRTYKDEDGESYYQLTLFPKAILPVQNAVKVAYVFDYDASYSSLGMTDMLQKVKNQLHANYDDRDSFNLIFSKLTPNIISKKWIAADSASIENTFASLGKNYVASYSTMATTISEACNFINNNNGGKLFLIANTTGMSNISSADDLINDLKSKINKNLEIHVIDYSDVYKYSYYHNDIAMYDNDYFYKKLTNLTGGSYQTIRFNQSSVDDLLSEAFKKAGNKINNFEVYPSLTDGFTYERFDNSETSAQLINNIYIQHGKFTGEFPFNVRVSGTLDNTSFSKSFNFSKSGLITGDVNIKKAYIGNKVAYMEMASQTYETISEIISNSITNRVLSKYTAFLALEPMPNTCPDCNDVILLSVDGESGEEVVQVSIYPNPVFADAMIKINTEKDLNICTLQIMDLTGKLVKTFDLASYPNNGTTEITWDGLDNSGAKLSNGMYYLVFNTPGKKFTTKVTLQRE